MLPHSWSAGQGPIPSTSTGGGPTVQAQNEANDNASVAAIKNSIAAASSSLLVLEPITSGCRVCFMKTMGQCQPLICDRIKSGITCRQCKGVRDNPRFSRQPEGTVVHFTSIPHGLVKATKNFSWAVVRVVPQRLLKDDESDEASTPDTINAATAENSERNPTEETGPLALLVMLLDGRGCLVLCGSKAIAELLHTQNQNCSSLLPFSMDYGRCTSHDTFYLDRCSRGKNRCSQQLPPEKAERNLQNFNGRLPEIRRRGQGRMSASPSARKRGRSPAKTTAKPAASMSTVPVPKPPASSPALPPPAVASCSSLPPPMSPLLIPQPLNQLKLPFVPPGARLPPPRIAIPSPSLSPAFAPTTSRWMPSRLEWDACQQRNKTFVLRQTFGDYPNVEITSVSIRWPGFMDKRLNYTRSQPPQGCMLQLQVEGLPHPLAPSFMQEHRQSNDDFHLALDAELVIKERWEHNTVTTRVPLTYVYGIGGVGVLPGPNRPQYGLSVRSPKPEAVQELLVAIQKLPSRISLTEAIASKSQIDQISREASSWTPIKITVPHNHAAKPSSSQTFVVSRASSDLTCPVAEVQIQVLSKEKTLRWSMKNARDLQFEVESLSSLGVTLPNSASKVVNGAIVIRHLSPNPSEDPHHPQQFIERRLLVEFEIPSPGNAATAVESTATSAITNTNSSANLTVATANVASRAMDLRAQKQTLKQNLADMEQRFGADSIQVADIALRLSALHGADSEFALQQKLLLHALRVIENRFGPDDVRVAGVMVALACCHGALGDAIGQKELLERALDIQVRAYGPTHPALAPTMNTLALSYGMLGEVSQQNRIIERLHKLVRP